MQRFGCFRAGMRSFLPGVARPYTLRSPAMMLDVRSCIPRYFARRLIPRWASSVSKSNDSAVNNDSRGDDNDEDGDADDSSNDNDDHDDDDDDDDTDEVCVDSGKLDALEFKNWDVAYLRHLEERGMLDLQPFYQRGYKWSQKQASMWMNASAELSA